MMAETEGNGVADGSGSQSVQFSVLAQYIKDLSFENPNAPESLRGPGKNPGLQINVKVNANKLEDDIFESEITLEAKATNEDGIIYMLELVYGGVFRIAGVAQEALHPILYVNCPTLLFPYVRRLVSDLSREGGFPPIMLDPVDFGILYQEKLRASGQTAESDASEDS